MTKVSTAFGMLVAVAALPAAAQSEGTHSESLCQVDEQVVFTCSVGNKLLSLCEGRTRDNSLRYAFGTRERPELSFPKSGASSATFFFAGDIPYARGSTTYIRFVNHGYEYILYHTDGHDPDPKDKNFRAWVYEGLAVAKENKLVAQHNCQPATSAKSIWDHPIARSAIPIESYTDQSERVEAILGQLRQ